MPSSLRTSMIALAAGALCLSAPVLAEEKTLTGAEIRSEIIGTPLKGKRMLMTAKILHARDGTSKLEAPIRKRSGTWAIKGNQLCVTWEGESKADCITFTRKGDGKYRIEPMGLTVTVDS